MKRVDASRGYAGLRSLLFDSVALSFAPKSRRINAERGCRGGESWTLCHHAHYVFALAILECSSAGRGKEHAGGAPIETVGQVAKRDGLRAHQRSGVLQGIAKLAHVSGPTIVGEGFGHFGG